MRKTMLAPLVLIAALQAAPVVAAAQGALTFSYNFPKSTTGAKFPISSLTYVGGNFYGESGSGSGAFGDIYELTASGKVRVVYGFPGVANGPAYPGGGLTAYNGKLYGVTSSGGTFGHGAVFALSSAGEQTIYSFVGGTTDGLQPGTAPTIVNGTIYGTTELGGANNAGTVYAISPAGKETVLHSFGAAAGDGQEPSGPLLAVGSTLYGTTSGGGTFRSTVCGLTGCGTLYSITTTGTETVLHSFDGANDGVQPKSTLFLLNGTLYGVTGGGGGANCGTAYTYTPGAGAITTIHQFAGGTTDVCGPVTGFAEMNGTLYATAGAPGSGSIFAMTPEGQTSIDFTFDQAEGQDLQSTLTPEGGTLWGAASEGGSADRGALFGVTP